MTASCYEQTGITVKFSPPPWLAGTYTARLYDRQISAYSHEIAADGGFKQAGITLKVPGYEIDDWLENGLGRRVDIWSPRLNKIWSGFVNRLMVANGSLSAVRGPLLQTSNKVKMFYSTIQQNDPPILGTRTSTAWYEDATSQAAWGVHQRVLSTGGASDAGAAQIVQTYLAEYKDPPSGEALSLGRAGEPAVTLELRGWADWFNEYVYNDTSGSSEAYSTTLAAVRAADPNGIFSASTAGISTNAATMWSYRNDNERALAVIKSIVARGDTSFNRWLWGVYEDEMLWYNVAPSAIEYLHHITDPAQRITLVSGEFIEPWEVRPGRWLFVPDYLIGRVMPDTALRKDPRAIFIESVRYSAPRGLEINGVKLRNLPQMLASMGISGIGG